MKFKKQSILHKASNSIGMFWYSFMLKSVFRFIGYSNSTLVQNLIFDTPPPPLFVQLEYSATLSLYNQENHDSA